MKTIKIHQLLLNLAKRMTRRAPHSSSYFADHQGEEYPLGGEQQPYVALAITLHQS